VFPTALRSSKYLILSFSFDSFAVVFCTHPLPLFIPVGTRNNVLDVGSFIVMSPSTSHAPELQPVQPGSFYRPTMSRTRYYLTLRVWKWWNHNIVEIGSSL